jgi:CRP/FNR family transcriptional regulator, nitrogen fixation regulation protein
MQSAMQSIQQVRSTSRQKSQDQKTPDALDVLEQFGTTVLIRRDHEIYAQGEPADWFWQIASGCVRTAKLMEDGRRQVGEFLWPGDFLAIDDIDVHDFNAEAVTDVELRRYPSRMVEALAQSHTALSTRLRSITLMKLRRANQHLIVLGRKSALEKVSSFLLDIHGRAGSTEDKCLDVPMTRTDIADYLGMAIETVCRTLGQLRREDIIAVSHSGIVLRDISALLGFVGI